MTSADKTRLDLIEAATQVFSENGYQRASTREICKRANANVAAVHYHFGDKAELYREVFRRPLQEYADRSASLDFSRLNFKDALAQYYRNMLEPLLSCEISCRLHQLHAREQIEPSGVLGDIRPQAFRRHLEQLSQLVCRELRLRKPDLEAQRLVIALEGMLIVYWHSGDLVQGFAPSLVSGKEWIERLSDRLAQFGADIVHAERRARASKNPSRRVPHASS